jgi:hypothetical protein
VVLLSQDKTTKEKNEMTNTLETIKSTKGIKSIEITKNGATINETGEKVDYVEIRYFTRGNMNIANKCGIITNPEIAEILAYHNSLPSFKQVRIISH